MLLSACAVGSRVNDEPEDYMSVTISPSQARVWMETYDNIVVLDVRTADEFATGHIRGAILLPVNEITTQAPNTLPDKDAMILVYCRSGMRSLNAAWILIDMGYTRVYEFGGILNWPYGTV